jgi:hypothetical protein
MNNPDERTAVDQFGKGDKYFGICTMLATMPGLPMFGHGQIQGYAEKYGMEFQRAYWDEKPDPHLVARHEREIFPLLRKRYLFADVENFQLYDFFAPEGHVNEDVFAYSNRTRGEKALVIYHNKYTEARGWIRSSVGYAVKTDDGQKIVQKTLGEGLALRDDPETFTIFRDHVSGMEFIRNNRELHEKGLYVELGAYKHHVFLDFREVQDTEWRQYAQLASQLNGRGVPSIDEALKEVLLQPIHYPFRDLVNAQLFRQAKERVGESAEAREALAEEVEQKMVRLLQGIKQLMGASEDEDAIAAEVREKLGVTLSLENRVALPAEVIDYLKYGPAAVPDVGLGDDLQTWATLLGWLFTHNLGRVVEEDDVAQVSRTWIDEWLLGKITAGALQDLGLDEGTAWWSVATIKILTTHQRWFELEAAEETRAYRVLTSWLEDDDVRRFLQVNRYQDVLWFNQEAFEQLLWWMFVIATVTISADAALEIDNITELYGFVEALQEAEEASGYQVEALLDAASR